MPAIESLIEPCPTGLTPDHAARFNRDGFLAFDGFLSQAEVGRLTAAMSETVRELVTEAREGQAEAKRRNEMRNYSGLNITSKRGKHSVLFEPDAVIDLHKSTLEELDLSFRKVSFPSVAHPEFKALSEHPTMRSMLDTLLGPGSILNGDMALCKPPRIGVAKPWHQDSAYFDYLPHDAGVDVWIALDDAAVDNGCMFVLPGGHKVGPTKHVHLDDCTIAEGRLDYSQAVPVEMKAGGILLFSVMLPHYTPPNRSEQRRRAVQFFYRAAHTRLIKPEEKAKTFLEADGTPASCIAAKQEPV